MIEVCISLSCPIPRFRGKPHHEDNTSCWGGGDRTAELGTQRWNGVSVSPLQFIGAHISRLLKSFSLLTLSAICWVIRFPTQLWGNLSPTMMLL